MRLVALGGLGRYGMSLALEPIHVYALMGLYFIGLYFIVLLFILFLIKITVPFTSIVCFKFNLLKSTDKNNIEIKEGKTFVYSIYIVAVRIRSFCVPSLCRRIARVLDSLIHFNKEFV